MKDMTEIKDDVKRTTRRAKRFLATPQGKKVGLLALVVGLGAATALVLRARRSR
jgi:hypothetical protein